MVMKIATIFVLLVAVRAVYGADIVVGGNSGWDQGFDYSAWAAGQTFKVGDALVFNYGGTHSVSEVNEDNYKACSSSNVIKSHTGGSTSIPLPTTGPRYFLCPTGGHCLGGMKLQVNVVAANAAPTPPSTPNTPPGTPSTPNSPPGTPSTPNTPPGSPTPSEATSTFLNLNHLFFGAFLAVMFLL